MNKYLSMLVALVVTLFTVNAMAFTAPPAPAKGFYVYDGTGKLTATQISALNHKIDRISQATKNEFGIAFLQSLGDADIEDAANATFRGWGIGKHGLDNGVLIMLSLKEHKSRIETGKGVGGEITDIQAKQILDGLRPILKAGDFFGAFNKALDDTSALLDSRANAKQQLTPMVNPTQAQQDAANRLAQQQGVPQPNAQPTAEQTSSGHGFLIFVLVVLGLGVVGLVLYLVFRRNDDDDSYSTSSYTPPAPSYNPPSYDPPARTVHHYEPTYTAPVRSVPLTPSIPSYTPPPAPAYVAPAPTPAPVEDNSSAILAAAAAATLLEEERAEERRREREEERREERREEERREARQREEEREEERRAERRREEESSSSSSSSSSDSGSSFDWGGGSSSGGSDSGGGFGGGDSGGGGASSDW